MTDCNYPRLEKSFQMCLQQPLPKLLMHLLHQWLVSVMLTQHSPPALHRGSASPACLPQEVLAIIFNPNLGFERQDGFRKSEGHCSATVVNTQLGMHKASSPLKVYADLDKSSTMLQLMYHLLRTWLRNITKMILSNTFVHHRNSAHFTGTYFNLHLNFGFIEW